MDARIHSSIHFDFPFNLEPHPWHLHHHPEASPHIFSERSTAHLGPTEHFDFNGGAEEATDHAIDSDNRITAETAAIEASLVETLPKGPAHDVSEFYIHNLRKRKVGRPRKHPLPILGSDGLPLKKIRGRPRLHPLPALGENGQPIKKKRGRPPKVKPLPDQTLEVLGNAELGEDMSFDADDEATSGLLHHSDSSNHLNTAGQRINPALVMDPAQRRLQEGSAPIESPDSIMSNPIALAESVAKDLSEVLGISRPLSVDDKINLHTEAEGFDPDHSRNMSNQVTLHHIESENDSPKRMRGRAKERSLITDPLGHLSPDFHSSNEAMVNSASELLGHHPPSGSLGPLLRPLSASFPPSLEPCREVLRNLGLGSPIELASLGRLGVEGRNYILNEAQKAGMTALDCAILLDEARIYATSPIYTVTNPPFS